MVKSRIRLLIATTKSYFLFGYKPKPEISSWVDGNKYAKFFKQLNDELFHVEYMNGSDTYSGCAFLINAENPQPKIDLPKGVGNNIFVRLRRIKVYLIISIYYLLNS